MGLTRSRPSLEILSGDSADVYFARAETILEREGLDPLVTMEVFTRESAVLCGIDEARNLLGHVLASSGPGRDAPRGAPGRRRHRAEGDRPADPGALPAVRALRDSLPRDARPVDRVGDRRADLRRGRGAGPGHQLRCAAYPSRHHRRARLRGDHRRLRRGLDARRRPAGRARPDRDDAALAGPDLRRHRRRGRRVRPSRRRRTCRGSCWSTRSRTRPRKRCASPTPSAIGSTASGSIRRPSAAGSPPTSSTRSAPASTRPGSSTSRSRSPAASTPIASAISRRPGRPVDSYAVGSYISGATPIDFTGDIKEIDGRPIAKRGRIPGLTDSPRLKPVDLAPFREG